MIAFLFVAMRVDFSQRYCNYCFKLLFNYKAATANLFDSVHEQKSKLNNNLTTFNTPTFLVLNITGCGAKSMPLLALPI